MPFSMAAAALVPTPLNTSGALPLAASTAPVEVAMVCRSVCTVPDALPRMPTSLALRLVICGRTIVFQSGHLLVSPGDSGGSSVASRITGSAPWRKHG